MRKIRNNTNQHTMLAILRTVRKCFSSNVMHEDRSHGGKVAYLGFINSDGNIPKLVRALLTGEKV